MKMTDEEFARIYRFVKQKYGIDMARKKEIMTGRLENYVITGGWKSFTDYMNAMETDATGQLEKKLVDLLTTNHTYFMREFEHMEFLRQVVLPELQRKEARSKDLGIWCAAASSGEEPYMLAMLIKDFFGLDHCNWDTQILATDVSTQILAQAIKGEYSEEQLASVPPQWKRRYFKKVINSDKYQVTKEIKDEIVFRKFNLMDPFLFRRKFHVIFLRNVMIYFDQKTKQQLIRKVYDSLEPGGYLFIGRTETIDRTDVPFHMIQPSIFRK